MNYFTIIILEIKKAESRGGEEGSTLLIVEDSDSEYDRAATTLVNFKSD